MAAPAGPSDQHGSGDTARARSAELVAAVFRALESVDGDVSPQLARAVQAKINVLKQIGREFGLLTESEAHGALGEGNATDLPDFGIRYRGETLYPGFLFEPSPGRVPMTVRPLLKDLKEIASESGWDGQDIVSWMTSPTTWFADHGPPSTTFMNLPKSSPHSQTRPAADCDQTAASFSYRTGHPNYWLGDGRRHGGQRSLT